MKGLLFTYSLTLYGVVASFVNPFHGLLVYVCFAIVKPPEMWPWSVPPYNYARVLAMAMFAGWILHGCGRFRVGRGSTVFALLCAFWLWCVLGWMLAPHPWLAWIYVDTIAKVLVPFVVGLTLIDSTKRLRQLIWVIVLSTGYVAFEMNLSYLGGYNRLQLEGFGGMDNNSAAIGLVTGLGVAFLLGLRGTTGWQRWVALGCAALIAHAVLLSFSRGAMVATIVATVAAFCVIPRTVNTTLAFGILVLAGLALAGSEVQDRFSTALAEGDDRDASAQSRLDLWAGCWDLMMRNPVLGVGPNHWPLHAPEYGFKRGKEAHSLWMQTGAESGFVGLFLLLAFYVTALRQCWRLTATRIQRRLDDPWLTEAARMVVMSLVGFVVAVQFVSLEGLEVPYFVALIAAATVKLAATRRRPSTSGSDHTAQPATTHTTPSFAPGTTLTV